MTWCWQGAMILLSVCGGCTRIALYPVGGTAEATIGIRSGRRDSQGGLSAAHSHLLEPILRINQPLLDDNMRLDRQDPIA